LLFPNGISEAVQVDFARQPKTANHLPQSLIFVDLVKMVVLCFQEIHTIFICLKQTISAASNL